VYISFVLYVYIQTCMRACIRARTRAHAYYMVQYKRAKNDENINFILNWKWNLREYLDLPMFIFIGNMYSLYVGSCLLLH
jgi:hypothetical protein